MALVQSSSPASQFGGGPIVDNGLTFTAGSLGILMLAESSQDALPPAAPSGWTVLTQNTPGYSTGTGFLTRCVIYYRVNMPSGSSAPSVATGVAGAKLQQYEFSGYSTSVAPDGVDENGVANGGGTVATWTTDAVSPSAGNQLVLVAISMAGINTTSNANVTSPSGYTSLHTSQSAMTDQICQFSYLERSSAGSIDATWGFDTNTYEKAAVIGVLRDPAGGSTFIPIIGRGPGMALVGSSGLVN